MPFTPITAADLAPQASPAFAPISASDLQPIEAPKAPPGALEALGRGALQGASFGLSDELTGAVESLLSSKTYQQARDEARANNAAAQAEHPWLYGSGELGGSVATSFIPGVGAAGKAVEAGLAGTRAAKVAGLAGGAVEGALQGGLAGFGGSEGSSASDIAADTVKGAGVGGAAGGVLHALTSKAVDSTEAKHASDTNADIFGRARPKDIKLAHQVQDANPAEFKEMLHSDEFEAVKTNARAGRIPEAIDAADKYVNHVTKDRLQNYAEASGGKATAEVGQIVNRFEKEASYAGSTEGRQGESKVLATMADYLRGTWSTVPRDVIADANVETQVGRELEKLTSFLPKTEQLTKKDVQQAAIDLARSTNPEAKAGDVPDALHQAIESLNFKYDPAAKVDLLRLRKATTAAQTHAKETLGSIAETEHYRIATAADHVMNDALEKSLNDAGAMSAEAKAAVERIRHNDKLISMGLAARDALETTLEKSTTGRQTTLGQKVVDTVGGLSKVAGVGNIIHGDVGTGAAEILAPYALKAVGAGVRRGNDTLAKIVYAAGQGNQWAQKQLAAFQALPGGAARVAALRSTTPGGPTPSAPPAAPTTLASAAPAPAPPAATTDEDEE